jgi:hypothetical protein
MSDRKAIPATKRAATRSTTKSQPKTKTLKEKLALNREKKKLTKAGRPRGSMISLLKKPVRFEIAIFTMLYSSFGFKESHKKIQAALLTVFLTASKPMSATVIDEVVLNLSTVRTSGFRHARYVVDQTETWQKNQTPEERDWMENSAAALGAFVLFSSAGNVMGQQYCLELLLKVDPEWKEIILRFSQRLLRALESNIPPHERKLSRSVQALVKKIREKSFQNQ